jgi:hypothetical protein
LQHIAQQTLPSLSTVFIPADALNSQFDGSTYCITHPDADLELDGWLRCFPEKASAREEWSRLIFRRTMLANT